MMGTLEFQITIRLRNQVLKIDEVYHRNETTRYDSENKEKKKTVCLLCQYIPEGKQEMSGPSDWIKTPDGAKWYIDLYLEKERVSLDNAKIKKNLGLRALAWLHLNSFWGKFSQLLNLKQSEFFHESKVDVFFRVLSYHAKEVENFYIVAKNQFK